MTRGKAVNGHVGQDQSTTPWNRLLGYITHRLRDERDGFNFSTGLDMGLAIALRHPEWAAAFRQSTQDDHAPRLMQTDSLVDEIVEAIPIEIRT